MIEHTATNCFIVPPIGKYERLYQGLLSRFISYEQLGNRLIYLAEQARTFKQIDTLSELALILSNLPIQRYRIIGQYYLALSICRNGLGDLEQAATILENVASNGPLNYRAEAMLSLSAISWDSDKPAETIRHCLEATKVGNFNTTIKALKGIAVLKGREGYHRSAVNDLEKLYPMFKYAPPYAYFDYLNSLAVELSEVGRIEEASNISTLVCTSSLAPYDAEWHRTRSEINQKLHKRRSSVTVPARIKPEESKTPPEARVINFPKREEITYEDLLAGRKEVRGIPLTPLQLLGVMLKAVLKERITDEEVDKLCSTYFYALTRFYEE